MQIIKVALENIKSYRKAVIYLGQGTTAIRGHNGAGKSTLVEAIGFALFDFLPYSPASRFVREGEKLGKVVVTFISALDDRVYEVERRVALSGSGGWFVFDPELRMKLAEGKEDTLDFLRHHLGMHTTLPLPDLFDNAVAVQQGTFTADFLQTASVRKKKFDALLQVEEYRSAADALRETASYLKDQLAAHDKTIERLAAQTADMPSWRAERVELAAAIVSLGEQMAQLVEERAAVEQRRDELTARQAEVARLEGERERAHSAWQVAQVRWQTAQGEADRAAEAQAICARTAADFARHRAAQDALAQAQADERAANALQVELASALKTIDAQSQAIQAAEHRLSEARQAAQERDRLAPLAARQGELEEHLNAAKLARQRLAQFQREEAQIASDLASAQQEADRTREQIAELEAKEALAAQKDTHRATLDRLQREGAAQGEREKRRASLADQRQRQLGRISATEDALRAATEQIAQAQAAEREASDLAAREQQAKDLERRIANLKAEISQAERSLHASKGGMCPFLKEPCQNIAQRGISSLSDYFSAQIMQQMEQVLPLEQQHGEVLAEVERLRALQSLAARGAEYAQAAAKARAECEEQRAELSRIDKELAELTAVPFDPQQHAAAVAEAEKLVKASAEADRACAKLPTLRSNFTRLSENVAKLAARRHQCVAEIAAAQEQAKLVESFAAELRALGDPRRQLAQCEARAQQMSGIQAELAQHAQARDAALAQRDDIQQRLAPYAGLAERIAALQNEIAATAAAHDEHLRHQAEARRLPEAQRAAQTAQEDVAKAEEAYQAASRAYDAVAATFDAAALSAANNRLQEMGNELAALRERLGQARQRAATLDAQIAEAETRLTELEAARAGRAETEATTSLLAYCRDTIKEAGPFVMRALLREISSQANRIFGEIMGDRSATLTWQEDYDIVLRSGAYERHFAQLSGGEQMSAALAVRLALLKTLTRASVAFFDEPTQNMDDERRTNLAAQIRRVSGFDQLVVISHDDTFEEGLDSVIWVRKEGGESAVESDLQATMPAPIIPFPTAIGA